MSAGSLFHTVAAVIAKVLVPMTVFVRCTTSFVVSADRKCRRLRTVEAKTQSSAKYYRLVRSYKVYVVCVNFFLLSLVRSRLGR